MSIRTVESLDEALAHIARYKRPIFPVEKGKSAIDIAYMTRMRQLCQ